MRQVGIQDGERTAIRRTQYQAGISVAVAGQQLVVECVRHATAAECSLEPQRAEQRRRAVSQDIPRQAIRLHRGQRYRSADLFRWPCLEQHGQPQRGTRMFGQSRRLTASLASLQT